MALVSTQIPQANNPERLDHPIDDRANPVMHATVNRLRATERVLLPMRRQRALLLADKVLKVWTACNDRASTPACAHHSTRVSPDCSAASSHTWAVSAFGTLRRKDMDTSMGSMSHRGQVAVLGVG